MENTGGPAKYLHKKFKKPTETSESVPQPVNNNASAIPTVTIHNAIKFETSKLLTTADATNITNVDHNKNSFKNSSTKTSLSNDQKASISTDLVPQKQPYSLPSSLHQTNSILDNVSTVLRLNKSSYDISSGSDDTQRSDDPQSSFSTCQTNVDVRKPQELSDTSKSNENEDKKQTEPSQSGKYVCSYCNLSCSKPSVLQKHIRAHTNERPYPCVSCGFSFKTRSNLYKHCRSRSHANRAKDSPEVSVSVSNKLPDILQQSATNAPVSVKVSDADCVNKSAMEVTGTNKNVELNMKSKPYKPKFHKLFHLEQNSVEDDKEKQEEKKVDVIPTKPFSSELVKQNPDLLKQHINNLIHKNQTILDVKEPNLLKKRILTNNSETDENLNRSYLKNCYETTDEPLNLTARNRKRCMSETEHTQKSLIKELLLKNLAQEQSYVCQFCKISFKNIENFESHRKNYCKVGQNPTSKDIAFVRSHSVNVASVLTQKYSRNNESPTKFVRTTLPLKSPGPFLGKTSLINDKPNQVFYENRNPTKLYPAAFSDLNKKDTSPVLQAPSKYNNENLLKMIPENESPKKRPYDDFQITLGRSNIKKPSVKLFGGEVITDTSEDIRNCVKLEPKSATEYSPNSPKFVGYGIKVSENMVIKSSLQSGGTVLQSTPTYENKMSPFTPSETPSPSFQFFSNREISPRKNYEIENGRRTTPTRFDFNIKPGQEQMYDQGLIEMNQKAAKMFAPNLKHPNLTIPGLPIPNKVFNSPKRHFSDNFDQVSPSWSTLHSPLFSPSIAKLRPDVNPTTPDVFTPTKSETIKFPESLKPLSYTVNNSVIVTRSSPVTGFGISLRDPLNIVVDGKLLRHVPGMPGPETASPVHLGFGPQILSSPIMSVPKIIRTSPLPKEKYNLYQEKQRDKFEHRKTPTKEMYERPASRNLDENLRKINESISISRSKNILEASEVQKKSLKNFRIFSENSMKTIKSIESSDRSDISSKSPLKAEVSECDESKSETHTITTIESQERPSSKFLRPNTLALKPYMKTHHGLTPTMFNQALISPDTPRVAKKYCQLYLNGNCFSYLGLKSSTKVTYCTLNKTQPFYVTSFGKLSMYSEWRHLESKINFNRMDTYDSRQRRRNYTVARTKVPDIVVDSSYKSVMVESPHKRDELNNRTTLPGGYESNEDYTYIRGRGRGRYVCDQCGIRCKKPSMLKKHIRTHSDVRPYTCQHCNFSFKTKGNLTKHMKSKSHYKRTNTNNGSSGEGNNCDNPPTNSGSPSDDDSDSDNEMDNDSDDSTRLQEHEAAHCLLSLAQNSTIITKPTNAECINVETRMSPCSTSDNELNLIVSKCNMSLSKEEKSDISEHPSVSKSNFMDNMFSKKPLMYPYYKVQSKQAAENPEKKIEILKSDLASNFNNVILGAKNIEFISQTIESLKNIHSSVDLLSPANISTPTKITLIGNKLPNADITLTTFQQKFVKYEQERAMGQNKGFDFNVKKQSNMQTLVENRQLLAISPDFRRKRTLEPEKLKVEVDTKRRTSPNQSVDVSFNKSEAGIHRKRHISVDILPHNINSNSRKRKISLDYGENFDIKKNLSHSLQKNNNQPYDMNTRAMDLSVSKDYVENRNASARNDDDLSTTSDVVGAALDLSRVSKSNNIQSVHHDSSANHEYRFNSEITNSEINQEIRMSIKKKLLNYKQEKKEEPVNHETPDKIRDECIINLTDNSQSDMDQNSSDNSINNNIKSCESDTSAMQTLAEIAMKRVNLENTKLAQSVASEYLKLATKNETVGSGVSESSAGSNGSSDAVLSDLIVKSEENKSCTICAKNFSKASQLRLHMNIHYLERPFRCESCSVSFRTKGHLQKHERSASHHNKLSSSPTTNSSEPRPFKCSDCNIAFRIHGHLAKHLRSKMHIMKLECLARVPFGLYAELERANSLLTEINTTDCDMCLDSLKILARKLFSNDPNKLELLENPPSISSNNQEQLAVGSP